MGYIRVGDGLRPFWGDSGGSFGPWKWAGAGICAPFPLGSPQNGPPVAPIKGIPPPARSVLGLIWGQVGGDGAGESISRMPWYYSRASTPFRGRGMISFATRKPRPPRARFVTRKRHGP